MGEKETASSVEGQDVMFNPKEYSVSRSEEVRPDAAASAGAAEARKGPNAVNVKLA